MPGRPTPEILLIPQFPCDPRHLPPASELPFLPTYSRPTSNTTGFHQATRFRSSSSRRSAPEKPHSTRLHHDGYRSAVFTEPTARYLPETLCARALAFSADPPQVFPADSRIAATPSTAIWLGWLPRQRHRSIHDTARPTFGPSGYTPSGLLRTTGDPRGTFVLPVPPRYRQLPLRTLPLHRLPGDDTSSGTATASLTAYLGDDDHPTSFLAPPPLTGPKPPLALQPSSTAQPQMTFPIPVHRYPGALPSSDTAHHVPTLFRHHGLPSSRVLFFLLFFFPRWNVFFVDRMFHRQWTPNRFLSVSLPHSRS